MSRKTLGNLERSVRALPAGPPPAPTPVPEPDLDLGQVAREAAQAFADQLDLYRRTRDKEDPLDPRKGPPEFLVQAIRDTPPEQVSFADLERLARVDPAAVPTLWAEVRAAAARDLDTGWHAGRAVETFGGSAWDRACFLVVRARLHRAWPPRNGGEALLLDQVAQYETLRHRWVTILANLTRSPQTILALQARGERPAAAGAGNEALRVIAGLHRLIQGTLRTLLGLRRAPAAVVVKQVEQINVAAGPQLNVNRPAAEGPGPEG